MWGCDEADVCGGGERWRLGPNPSFPTRERDDRGDEGQEGGGRWSRLGQYIRKLGENGSGL
jgi:hypothetical protein